MQEPAAVDREGMDPHHFHDLGNVAAMVHCHVGVAADVRRVEGEAIGIDGSLRRREEVGVGRCTCLRRRSSSSETGPGAVVTAANPITSPV